jgi:hypothetical protein
LSGSGDDGAKKIILARRARFVAAAVAGLGIACGKEVASRPCLSVAYVPDGGGPSAAPEPPAEAGAAADAPSASASASDGGAPPADKPLADKPLVDAGAPDAKPHHPLTPQPLPTLQPQPCLKIAPPTRGR